MTQIRKDVLWTTLAQGVQSVLALGMTVFFARLDASGALIGTYVLASAISTPVFVFLGLQLRSVLATDAKNEFRFSTYVGVRVAMLAIALVGLVVYAAASSKDMPLKELIVTLSALKSVELMCDVYQGLLQRHGWLQQMSIAMMMRAMVVFVIVAAATLAGVSIGIAFLYATIGALVVFVAIDLHFVRELKKSFAHSASFSLRPKADLNEARALFLKALPSGASALLGAIYTQLPLLLMERASGRAALGRLAAIYTPLIAAQILMAAPLDGVVARLANAIAHRDRALFERLLRGVFLLAGTLSVLLVGGALLLGPYVVARLYGVSYASDPLTLVLLSLGTAVGFFSAALAIVLMASRAYASIFKRGAIGFACAVATYAIVVPKYGALGVSAGFVALNMLGAALLVRPALAVVREVRRPAFVQ